MAFNSIKDAVNQFKNSDKEILFIHIREPEEIQRAKDFFDAKTLLIKRENLKNIETNYSDANVDKFQYDYIIKNTTLEELENNALSFVNELCQSKTKKLI